MYVIQELDLRNVTRWILENTASKLTLTLNEIKTRPDYNAFSLSPSNVATLALLKGPEPVM